MSMWQEMSARVKMINIVLHKGVQFFRKNNFMINNKYLTYLASFILFITANLYVCGSVYSQNNSEYPTVTKSIGSQNFEKYKRLAVLPFADAPYAPQSGQTAQSIASTIFAKAGFHVVERSRLYNILDEQKLMSSGLIDEKQSVRLGKLLGANAVVVGTVGQYQTISKHTEPYYETVYNPCDAECEKDVMWLSALKSPEYALEVLKERNKPKYILREGKSWNEAYVSVSLRVIDVETGLQIYAASGFYEKGYTNPPQQLLEFIMQALVIEWGKEHQPIHHDNAGDCEENCFRMYKKGELRKGLTIDQCIQILCK